MLLQMRLDWVLLTAWTRLEGILNVLTLRPLWLRRHWRMLHVLIATELLLHVLEGALSGLAHRRRTVEAHLRRGTLRSTVTHLLLRWDVLRVANELGVGIRYERRVPSLRWRRVKGTAILRTRSESGAVVVRREVLLRTLLLEYAVVAEVALRVRSGVR